MPLGTVPIAIPRAVAAALSLFVVAVVGWAMLADDPSGGEPTAIVPANLTAVNSGGRSDDTAIRTSEAPGGARPSRYDGPPAGPGTSPAAAGRTITIIDGTSGKRQEVVIPQVGAQTTVAGESTTADERLTENSRHGAIPRVAADGTRASELFAQPVKPIAGKPNAPRVAIVVGGLGIGADTTNGALDKLPGAVTLAFAPYGSHLGELAARARSGGHELLLQVPMEPFDYPDNDPGPQTLLTSLDAGANIDRLQWAMSRLAGYVGIANLMGARFTASEPALGPIMREAGKRGLIYLDDGSSPRSLAAQIAGTNNIGFAKADLAIDSVPTGTEVERALGRLETMARERGLAVGVTGPLPVAIERIAKWAKGAEGRGLLLIPISAVAKRPIEDRRRTTDVR
jgi:polysaccharide deacetylase 2 family uncharacterized protein YibQ